MNSDSIPDSELPPPLGREVVFANLIEQLKHGQTQASSYASKLPLLLQQCRTFLQTAPTPPQTWFSRVGDQASRFDYHQIVLPENLSNPLLDDLENIAVLEKEYADCSSQALEYYLISYNRMLYTDGHFPPVYAPKPLILFDQLAGDEENPKDAFLYIYPDNSYICYGLEDESNPEEYVGESVIPLIKQHYEIISRLHIKFPAEHEDYGYIGCH